MHRIKLALLIPLAAVMAALGITASAQGSVHVHPNLSSGTYCITETSSNPSVYISFAVGSAGNPILEESACRLWTFNVTTTYNGHNAGTWTSNNGTLLATTNDCTKWTQKSDPTSFGTIIEANPINANLAQYALVPRACDQQLDAGGNLTSLAARDSVGNQPTLCVRLNTCSGFFTNMSI